MMEPNIDTWVLLGSQGGQGLLPLQPASASSTGPYEVWGLVTCAGEQMWGRQVCVRQVFEGGSGVSRFSQNRH